MFVSRDRYVVRGDHHQCRIGLIYHDTIYEEKHSFIRKHYAASPQGLAAPVPCLS